MLKILVSALFICATSIALAAPSIPPMKPIGGVQGCSPHSTDGKIPCGIAIPK